MDRQRFRELCEQLLEPQVKSTIKTQSPVNGRQEGSMRLAARPQIRACDICGKQVKGNEIFYDLLRHRRRCNQNNMICPLTTHYKNKPYK